jgi:sulfur relay (sulfurtransferase) complex TusBCD TusD component (DsrE family)
MTSYVLIESRDPFESSGFAHRCELALALRADGADVTVFLVENAVLGARANAELRDLARLSKAGVPVLADEFALRERGVGEHEIGAAVRPASLTTLVHHLVGGAKALWN